MTLEQLIEMVHERDALVDERNSIDEKIRAVEARISQMTGLANGQTGSLATGNGAGLASGKEPAHPRSPQVGSDFLLRFHQVPSAPSHTDRVLAMIRANEGRLDYGEVARQLYGEDTVATRKRLRSILSALNQAGRISNAGRNQWRIEEAAAGGAAVT